MESGENKAEGVTAAADADENPGLLPEKQEEKPEAKPEAKHERTAKKLISQMIGKYVSLEEKRAQFLRDGAEALCEYRARGLRVTSHEVLSWLELWGEDDGSEGPECHA